MPHKRRAQSRGSYPSYSNVASSGGMTPAYRPATSNGRAAGYGTGNVNNYARNAAAYHAVAKKQMGRGKKIAIAIIASCLAVLLGCGTAFALYMNYIDSQLKGNLSDQERMAISDALGYGTSLNEPFYMMLLGSDRRSDETGPSRSDTNIVARVDPINDTVSMVSIPRDTKIEIKGHGTQKFNAAYAFGGAAGAIKAAEELLDIDITHYAEVSFLDLAGLVDAVGGVTVENESKIDNWKCDDGDGNHYIIEKGTQHLNGGQALTFARNRDYPDGDFTRQKHQRAVIEGVVAAVLDMPITGIPGVIEAAVKCVTTDLSALDIIGLAQKFADADDIVFYSAMLPSYPQNINGISFVINDEEKTAEMMKLFKAGEDPSGIVSNKSGKDITTSDIDTSNTLLFADDDEVISGNRKPQTNTSTPSGGNSGNTGSSGNEGGNTGTTDPDPDTPTPPSGGGDQGGNEDGDSGGGNEGGGEGGQTTNP